MYPQEKPRDASTPNTGKVASRRNIHDHNTDDVISPIPITSTNAGAAASNRLSPLLPKKDYNGGKSQSDDEDTNKSSSDLLSKESGSSYATGNCETSEGFYLEQELDVVPEKFNRGQLFLVLSVCVGVVLAYPAYTLVYPEASSTSSQPQINISSLRLEYPKQNEDLWSALESGIKEVRTFNKPSVYLLLYKKEGEETLERLLKNISMYANCILNQDCSENVRAIVLTSEQLGKSRAVSDYGYLLDSYGDKLRQHSVMIVKNLDEVPSLVAPAFHSFCDEYEPMVAKSVFFFTMKVPYFPDKEMQYVENVLRTNWKDLKQDHFDPLFTRISNMILKIETEENYHST